MWHSCGLLKKFGYDAADDVPAGYKGNVYRNYDLVTVSAECVEGPISGAMRQKEGIVRATGVSRTDVYFDSRWREDCRKRFFEVFPGAIGKKVILWAPTFRGGASFPTLEGEEEIRKLGEDLGDGYYVVTRKHPYLERENSVSECELPTEEIFTAADLLITDYSSALFDFLFFRRPFVLFAPDLERYGRERGFYVPYESLCPYTVTDPDQLKDAVLTALADEDRAWIEEMAEQYNGACDGSATARILDHAGLRGV